MNGKKLHRVLEYTNHLSNVLTVISDKKLYNSTAQSYSSQVVSTSDYYPFGLSMYGKQYDSGRYRFGYQGSEKNKEQEGSYTTFHRQLDTRIGRWLSIDPITHPFQSPYSSMNNSPTATIDPSGGSGIGTIDRKNKTITIRSRLLFYGKIRGKRKKELKKYAESLAKSINNSWNAANGTIDLEGVTYKVKFDVTANYIGRNYRAVARQAATNTSQEINYIRLSNTGKKITVSNDYGNSAIWDMGQIAEAPNTTPAHEYGHLMGWYDADQNNPHAEYMSKDHELQGLSRGGKHDLLGTVSSDGRYTIPGIMMAGGMTADGPKRFGRPPLGQQYLKPGPRRVMNLDTRVVTARDIALINRAWMSNAMIIEGDKIIMGRVSNIIKDGNDKIISRGNTYQNIIKDPPHVEDQLRY